MSTVASLYDPLGFAGPVILEAKALLQQLCKQRTDWDDPIEHSDVRSWQLWQEKLLYLNNTKVPRCFKPFEFGSISEVQLHYFSDASSYAYGACSYLRMTNENGVVSLSFLIGKCRLAPIKAVTIPRLGLTAAVLAVRLDELIRKELNFPNCASFFWTDSTAVLFCIRNNTNKYPVFVANRLAIIEEHTDAHNWRHVPSNLNPADSASRGLDPEKLDSDKWLRGPSFLLNSESQWPETISLTYEPSSEISSIKANVMQTTTKVKNDNNVIDRLIDRCSSLHKLKRLTAWLLRLISYLQQRVSKFLNALRRFISRRGTPSNIYSDNGTNFVGANRILKEALQQFDQTRQKNYCSQLEINWHFNPPHASHMGGAWQRMIRSVKRILGALMQ